MTAQFGPSGRAGDQPHLLRRVVCGARSLCRSAVVLGLVVAAAPAQAATINYDALLRSLAFLADDSEADAVSITSPAFNQLRIVVANGDTINLTGDTGTAFILSAGDTQLDIDMSAAPIDRLFVALDDLADDTQDDQAFLHMPDWPGYAIVGSLRIEGGGGSDILTLVAVRTSGDQYYRGMDDIRLEGPVSTPGNVEFWTGVIDLRTRRPHLTAERVVFSSVRLIFPVPSLPYPFPGPLQVFGDVWLTDGVVEVWDPSQPTRGGGDFDLITAAGGVTAVGELQRVLPNCAFAVEVSGNLKLSVPSVPTACAGPDRTVNEGQVITLDGSDSHAALAQRLTYQWTQIAPADVSVALEGADTATPTFTAPQVALNTVFTFQFVITDADNGLTNGPDTVDVMVLDIDLPPVADAGGDTSVREGATGMLDGTGSYDPEGLALTYEWTQTGGPPVALDLTDSAKPTFTAPLVAIGTVLTFELKVADPGHGTSTDAVAITVSANNPPVADAGQDQTLNEGSVAMLDGSASSDPDGDHVSYAWMQLEGPLVSLNLADPAKPTFTAPSVAAGGVGLVFRLFVEDDFAPDPLSSAPDDMTVHVQNVNDPPNCGAARPSAGTLWPPNHKMVRVEVLGLTDTSGSDAVTLTITAVTSDEPMSGPGDPHHPDAAILGDGSLLLRAERAGGGNGRVYVVHFTATDGVDSCGGSVRVTVPHDRRGSDAIDDGQFHDAKSGPSASGSTNDDARTP